MIITFPFFCTLISQFQGDQKNWSFGQETKVTDPSRASMQLRISSTIYSSSFS